MTVNDTAARWLTERRAALKPLALRIYRRTYDGYVRAAIGHLAIAELNRPAVRGLLLTLLDRGYSVATCRLVCIVLSGVAKYAITESLLSDNPVRGAAVVLGPARKRDRREADVVRRADADALTHALLAVSPTPAYPVYFLILARTGVRPGEANALRVDDLDFAQRRIRIAGTFTDGHLGDTPKGGRARFVDMSTQLAAVLRGYLDATDLRAGFLFPGRTGDKPLWPGNFQKVLKKALRAAKMPRSIHPHAYRHGYATTLLEEGIADLFYVQRQMGHSTIRTTCDLYAASAEPRNLEAVDKLDSPNWRLEDWPRVDRRPPLRLVVSRRKQRPA